MASLQDLILTPMATADIPQAFHLYKKELQTLVDEAFGWNEEFERRHFQRGYKPEWFFWIQEGHEKIGYLCYHESRHEINISFLVIRGKFQNSHYGARVMDKIRSEALHKKKPATLSVLVNNKRAQEFYKRQGYEILRRDSDFYEMILKADKTPSTSRSSAASPPSEAP